MIKRPINYIFLEGPDLSGKTTLYENIHKVTNYKWNIQDRSALSMLVHAKFYNRNAFRHTEQLRSEVYNLNNVIIILLPVWEEIARRFNHRGDPIQNITSLRKIYDLFVDAAEELKHLPNVFIINNIADQYAVSYIINKLNNYENGSLIEVQKNCLTACDSKESGEIVGLNFTIYDDGSFDDVDKDDLLYEEEVEYYEEILGEIDLKISKELLGDNEHSRKETFESRRFIYSSDTCISLAHFMLRADALDCKFFLRSSNVKDTLYYDINFLKHVASKVYEKLEIENKFCRLNFVINSGHVIRGEE